MSTPAEGVPAAAAEVPAAAAGLHLIFGSPLGPLSAREVREYV